MSVYMFAVLLMLTCLISSFGGAIRYKENFMNEVFDTVDDDNSEKEKEVKGFEENIPSEAPIENKEIPPVPPTKSEDTELLKVDAYEEDLYAEF